MNGKELEPLIMDYDLGIFPEIMDDGNILIEIKNLANDNLIYEAIGATLPEALHNLADKMN